MEQLNVSLLLQLSKQLLKPENIGTNFNPLN